VRCCQGRPLGERARAQEAGRGRTCSARGRRLATATIHAMGIATAGPSGASKASASACCVRLRDPRRGALAEGKARVHARARMSDIKPTRATSGGCIGRTKTIRSEAEALSSILGLKALDSTGLNNNKTHTYTHTHTHTNTHTHTHTNPAL
jgi:hypothetical protein